ncbi:hypothetical protein EDB83DRAFT_2385870 [Lactarius deliciosus]|nr:hypothetical protein EDB83DRAFT_2385870 [Lactarius deliciosus]
MDQACALLLKPFLFPTSVLTHSTPYVTPYILHKHYAQVMKSPLSVRSIYFTRTLSRTKLPPPTSPQEDWSLAYSKDKRIVYEGISSDKI